MYRIIGADDKEYGPVEAEQVRQWLREGRANRTTLVKSEGSPDWKAIGALPEFADLPMNLGAGTARPRPAWWGRAVPTPVQRFNARRWSREILFPPLPSAPAQPGGPTKTCGMATASLVCGALGFACIPAIVGQVLGFLAHNRIRQSGGRLTGSGLATAGLVLSLIYEHLQNHRGR